MKYRWGFLDENGIFSECQPKVDDSTAIDFSQESGEMFYRGKINGSLAFRFEFDDILSKGYNYEHIVILQWYDADNDEWKEVWKGRFALTDCEIDYDTKTITVQPTTLDRYTTILNHLEDEYNLIKLAAQQQPVGILIRPCLQIYALNHDKISNCIGNNAWIAACNSVGNADIANYHFTKKMERIAFMVHYNFHWSYGEQTVIYIGEPEYDYDVVIDGLHRAFYVTGQYYDNYYNEWRTHTLVAGLTQYSDESVFYLALGIGSPGEAVTFTFDRDESGTACSVYLGGTTVVDDANADWQKIYGRIILQTDAAQWLGYTLYDLDSNDMAGLNLNYNKIADIAAIQTVFSSDTQTAPTEWGQAYTDKYFIKPTIAGKYWNPVGQGLWKYMSWWYIDEMPQSAYNSVTVQRTIKDCYKLPSIITRLFQKAGLTPQYFISRVLNGNNDYVGEPFYLCITPRSNVISSYYDTPAQNAPITLTKILMMLKQTYQIYWHIDANGNIHFEHISYYDNGYNYTEDAPGLLVDLESELHTNTKNNKVFGQNKVKFDKQDMPQQIKFSWEDAQTPPFEGYAIKMIDKYVNQGNTEENAIGAFDSDVDFVLASPNDVSKDGMFLFACPQIDGSIAWRMDIQMFTITDENGEHYDVSIQNADAAFWKIHQSFWRYSLPCENVNINNEDTTAITTGRFKVQSVEFADSVMADILRDIDNCNKVIRTQQGDGHIKTISINLNSLVAKGDLLFNFIGRWYYLKGTAIGSSITIFVNGESITVDVTDNKFTYRYKEPISALQFNAADVVFVNFADCDKLDNLTSCDAMFDGCEELIAVDFGGKTFGAVTTANNMFRGCVALTTLICPDSSTWKADLDLSDCPDLTTESLYDLIKFLYFYESGVHTITPNSTMWNALDGDTQTDLIAKATERGWTINMPAAYSITGQSAANTVYATINGSPVEIPVTAGQWQYDYNAAITSISFENDADLTSVEFSLSDGLAGVTSLNDAFKNCAGLTSVDFTGCDLTNLVSASDAFAGCTSLYELIIPAGTWKPDVDLSATAIAYAEMSNVVGGLYTYSSGTHTITFNSTIWDALSVAQQQTIFDAAQLKWWTTNAVAVVYVVRGTSSNVNGTETFNIQFILDEQLTPEAAEQITCAVDSQGNWEYAYSRKKIYSLHSGFLSGTLTTIEFTEEFAECVSLEETFGQANQNSALTHVSFPNATFEKVTTLRNMCWYCTQLQSFSAPNATLGNLQNADRMFSRTSSLLNLNLGLTTFANATSAEGMFYMCGLQNLSLPYATFANLLNALDMFGLSTSTTINLPSATFASVTNGEGMFKNCTQLQSFSAPNATFGNLQNADRMFSRTSSLLNLNLGLTTFANATSAEGMFYMCGLQNFSLPYATFANLLNALDMFELSTSTTINLPSATFASVTNGEGMFKDCRAATTINLPSATFASVTNAYNMFLNTIKVAEHYLPLATFENTTNASQVFAVQSAIAAQCVTTKIDIPKATFANATTMLSFTINRRTLQTLLMPLATFNKIATTTSCFNNCVAMTTLDVPQNSTAILPTSTAGNAPMNLAQSPLNYASMLKVANWLSDLTGYTAHTCTFKASAWNALSTAEQNNIDSILSGKNWTRAIA